MRQRNDTHDELVAWTDPVLVIGPGDTIEWDYPLVGLTVLDDQTEPEPTEPTVEAEPDAKETAEATPEYDTIEEPS